jgi:dihydropteroate synthase
LAVARRSYNSYNKGMVKSRRCDNCIPIVVNSTYKEWDSLFSLMGVDPSVFQKLSEKSNTFVVFIKDVPAIPANIIKQEALSKGGEAAISRETLVNLDCTTDVLIALTERRWVVFLEGLNAQPFGLKELGHNIATILSKFKEGPTPMAIRNNVVDWSKTLIMGILNVTPDSFSDGGKYNHVEAAVTHAKQLIREGADIIDIGGESTRPGSQSVSLEEELSRVIPVITGIRLVDNLIPISIDTTKAKVAKAALQAGADCINDISAGTFDAQMFDVAAQAGCPIFLMHTLAKPDIMQQDIKYDDLIAEILDFLQRQIKKATGIGIDRAKIMIDPGIGFGKTTEDNLRIINRLSQFKGAGCPILMGTSNKRFIGDLTGREVSDRGYGTAATIALSIANGANMVRVHNVAELKDVVLMADAVRRESCYE